MPGPGVPIKPGFGLMGWRPGVCPLAPVFDILFWAQAHANRLRPTLVLRGYLVVPPPPKGLSILPGVPSCPTKPLFWRGYLVVPPPPKGCRSFLVIVLPHKTLVLEGLLRVIINLANQKLLD